MNKGTLLEGPNGPNSIEVGERIGGGRFGHVFAATDTVSKRPLAVKVPQAQGIEAVAFRGDLLAAQRVRHPNVIEILWTAADAAPPYIVMEMVSGPSLLAEINQRRAARDLLSLPQLKIWLDDIIQGMAAINAHLLHRDIKPDNVLIDGSRRLKIGDFGLAKIVDAATRSATFKYVGALAYMAPEVWEHETNTIQRDMYAVGITMLEMATLEYPLPLPVERTTDKWKRTHIAGRPKKPSESRSDLPAGVERVLLKLIAKRPQDRFATWDDVSRELAAAWSTSLLGAGDPHSERIVRALSERRLEREDSDAAARLKAEREKTLSEAVSYQWNALVETIQSGFSDLVEAGVLSVSAEAGSITVKADGQQVGSAHLEYLHGDGYRFRNGSFVKTAVLFSTVCKQGFNAVLIRTNDEDMYGEWQGIAWSHHALYGQRDGRREPFGMAGSELTTELRYMQGLTGRFTVERIGDIPMQFKKLIADCLDRRV